MYRCWYSECRRRKRHRSIAEDYASQPDDNNPGTTEDLPLLKRALAELPEAEQKIIAMRFAQYSYAEIAKELQLASEDAAAKRVQRILTKLQKLMSDKIKARAKGGLG
jgi:RNA polymerase sigma factor (sigma-70 family)